MVFMSGVFYQLGSSSNYWLCVSYYFLALYDLPWPLYYNEVLYYILYISKLDMPCETRHMTCDMWWVVNILSIFQLPSCYGLWKTVFWRLRGKGSLTWWINKWINYKYIYKKYFITAPATLCLLIIQYFQSIRPLGRCFL